MFLTLIEATATDGSDRWLVKMAVFQWKTACNHTDCIQSSRAKDTPITTPPAT